MPEQDPLAQLRDIHLPDAISIWPPAPGWWLVLLIVAALLAVGIIALRNYLQSNRYRKQALQQLALLDLQNPSVYLQQLNRLLKQTALAGEPNRDIAGLSGQQWLSYLDSTGDSTDFSQGAANALAHGPYAPETANLDTSELQHIAEQWIKKHDLRRSAKPSC